MSNRSNSSNRPVSFMGQPVTFDESVPSTSYNVNFASVIGPIPVPSFAEQMLIGQEGKDARRRSSDFNATRMDMQADLDQMMSTLYEDDDEKEKTDDPPMLSKQLRRVSMTHNQLKMYGVVDKVTERMLVNTLGIDAGDAGPLLKHDLSSDIFDDSAVTGGTLNDPYNLKFEAAFGPDQMRCLALVAHNHMKPAMKEFVKSHKEILRKFRLTGTNTTMTMLKDAFGDDPTVQYGPAFQSGPLGGDAELCALMCLEDLGGCIFFQDPLSAHPHQADIDSLTRLCNVHNILTANNPCTAHALCFVLKCALEAGRKDKIPSFFCSLKSPGVAVYKEQQKRALEAAKKS